jgi:hypothetical protein
MQFLGEHSSFRSETGKLRSSSGRDTLSLWIIAIAMLIGLNAIAQWVFTLDNPMPQGLGTGGLFTNNFKSPLCVKKGYIYTDNNQSWKANLIQDLCL